MTPNTIAENQLNGFLTVNKKMVVSAQSQEKDFSLMKMELVNGDLYLFTAMINRDKSTQVTGMVQLTLLIFVVSTFYLTLKILVYLLKEWPKHTVREHLLTHRLDTTFLWTVCPSRVSMNSMLSSRAES